jgi:hypothetical protein
MSRTDEAPRWVEVEAIARGLDDNRLPPTDELAGRELTLRFADGETVRCAFLDARRLDWRVVDGAGTGTGSEERYEAVRVAPDVHLVTFVKRAEPLVSISIALDTASRRATAVIGTMPSLEEARTDLIARMKRGFDLSAVRVEMRSAVVEPRSPDESIVPHVPTTDLVGKRMRYRYGDGAVYEHVYLNERLYTWHCLAGPERGLADTERCDYLRVTSDVVLFCWREKVVPTLGVVLVNLAEMRSTGILFGIDTDTGAPIHFGIGARGELLNVTPPLPGARATAD